VRRFLCIVQKSAVLQQLGVKSAIVAMIDLLGHQAIKHRAAFRQGRARINDQHRLIGAGGCERRKEPSRRGNYF